MMLHLRRNVAVVLIGLAPITLAACGGSSKDDTGTAIDTTPTTVDTGDFAIDQAIDTGAAEAALLAMDDQSAKLPDDAKSSFDRLEADVATAEQATGNDAEAAWKRVSDDVSDLDSKITAAGSDVDSAAKQVWTDVRNELDKIISRS